jgi:hypothetical protein
MRTYLRQTLGIFSAIGVLFLLTIAGCNSNKSNSSSNNGSAANTGTSGGSAPSTGDVSVLTYHYNNARTGENTQETTLTPENVKSATFGKIGFDKVDGKVDAEPLYVPHMEIKGNTRNVLFVVTEHDSAYAFDADDGTPLWHVSLLKQGETPTDNRHCSQVTPEIGVTSTPVIDPKAGDHGTMYIVAASKDSSGNYHQRLHAIDLATGAERPGSPVEIQGTYPSMGPLSQNGQVVFDPKQYNERAGLLLLNGVVYMAWSSHCDIDPYTGWIMGYDENNLKQVSVLNTVPNGTEGAFWQAGDGPAADSDGNFYLLEGNGTFDTNLNSKGFPSKGDYGNAFLKISTANNKLSVADYFMMSNTVEESKKDVDLGSGGAIVLPDMKNDAGKVMHLAVGAGKDQNIYVVNRDDMGKFSPSGNNIYQELKGGLEGREFGTPAYWNNTVYYGAVNDVIRAFPISNAKLATNPSSTTSIKFTYPGAIPAVSSNGTSNGIVWAVENSDPAVLYAYDATNLGNELYDSNQAANSRDQFGAGNKFITPVVVNGKVYVGTQDGVAVFGLLKK